MMMLPRDVHAESNDLHESVPRKRPLQHATAWLLATSPILGTNSHFEIGENAVQSGAPVTIIGRSQAIISKSSFTSLTFMWSIRFVLAQINCKPLVSIPNLQPWLRNGLVWQSR